MIIFKPHEKLILLQSLLPHNPIIIEAGAFTGNDTCAFIRQWPAATIYAFEPVPEIYAQLVANTKQFPFVHCYQIALSDTNGTALLHILSKKNKPHSASQAGSLHEPTHLVTAHKTMDYAGTITVNTITLDTFAAQNNITSIDLLWLDLQGHELAVLHHAKTILASIKFIYTEINFIDRYHQQPTYQMLTDYLFSQGFEEIARDFATTQGRRFGNLLFKKK